MRVGPLPETIATTVCTERNGQTIVVSSGNLVFMVGFYCDICFIRADGDGGAVYSPAVVQYRTYQTSTGALPVAAVLVVAEEVKVISNLLVLEALKVALLATLAAQMLVLVEPAEPEALAEMVEDMGPQGLMEAPEIQEALEQTATILMVKLALVVLVAVVAARLAIIFEVWAM